MPERVSTTLVIVLLVLAFAAIAALSVARLLALG